MNREYLNEVRFKAADKVKLGKPKLEKPAPIKRGSINGPLKLVFTFFIIIVFLFLANFVIVTTVNAFKGTDFKTVFQVWGDFQKYERKHSY